MNFSEMAMRNLRNLGRWMWNWYLRGGNSEVTAIDDKDYRGEEEKQRGRDLEFRAQHIRQELNGKKASRAAIYFDRVRRHG